MFERKRFPIIKTAAVVGAVALLLIPTWLLIRQDIAFKQFRQHPLAVIDILNCGDHATAVITGDGVIHPVPDLSPDQIVQLVKQVGPHSAMGFEVPCAVPVPQQQTFLQ